MRLDINDADFNWDVGRRAEVYLNGVQQNLCTVADEEKGYIVRYPKDPEKRLNEEMETVYGEVKIVIRGD